MISEICAISVLLSDWFSNTSRVEEWHRNMDKMQCVLESRYVALSLKGKGLALTGPIADYHKAC